MYNKIGDKVVLRNDITKIGTVVEIDKPIKGKFNKIQIGVIWDKYDFIIKYDWDSEEIFPYTVIKELILDK